MSAGPTAIDDRKSTTSAAGAGRPTLGAVWLALAEVPDPEIPAVTVVDLGILRSIGWDAIDATSVVVTVTPTYSGCPATEFIAASIRDAALAAGAANVRVEMRLHPAWTTEWITPEGRRKLRAFGIAPPEGERAAVAASTIDVTGISPLRRSKVVVACPRCASGRTRLLSQFGSTACKAQYRCLDCLEPFDYFKAH